MAVHRVSDKAERALQRIAKEEGRTPSEIINDLVLGYDRAQSVWKRKKSDA